MNKDSQLLDRFIKDHPADAARILEQLKIEQIVPLVEELPIELNAAVLNQLERFTAAKCLENLNTKQAAEIVACLPIETAAVLLRRLQDKITVAILEEVPEEKAEALRRNLRYSANTAGAIMDPLVFTFPDDITVREALKRIRKRPEKARFYIYVVNRDHLLSGVLNIRELLLGNAADPLVAIMHTQVESLSPDAHLQAILEHPGWLEYHALPVIDSTGRLLGVIQYETLRSLDASSHKSQALRQAAIAGGALGELYRIGLSGLVRSAGTAAADVIKTEEGK